MFFAGSTAFLIGVSWGGNEFAWDSAATLVPLIVGLAIVVGTCAYERYFARNPFLRLSLFRSTSAVAVYACTLLQSLTVSIAYNLGVSLTDDCTAFRRDLLPESLPPDREAVFSSRQRHSFPCLRLYGGTGVWHDRLAHHKVRLLQMGNFLRLVSKT